MTRSYRLLVLAVVLLTALALVVSGAAPVSAQNVVGPPYQSLILTVGPQSTAVHTIVGPVGLPLRQTESATGVAADTAGDTSADAGADAGANTCVTNSFTPTTEVVMADGSKRPLDQVKVGDKVEATDPVTGKTSAQTVTTVWVNQDTDLMNVTVNAGGVTSTIHATQHHLFWVPAKRAWVEADQLAAGEQLRTDKGTTATVAATVVIPGAADMWDLTVSNDHDFYVVTAASGVLVHNEGCDIPIGGAAGELDDEELAQAAYQHSGQGYAEGETRPSESEILNTIQKGARSPIENDDGTTSIQIQTPTVRVIINQSQPFRSTAYYRGQ